MNSSSLVVDTHVHLYPCHDRLDGLISALQNLEALAPGTARAICLTERFDCSVFNELGRESHVGDFSIHVASEKEALILRSSAGDELLVFAGRQIITAERLEVLALTTLEVIPDGLPIRETIARVRELQGVPVLPWSPGKWFFARGQVIRSLLRELSPGDVLLGDVTLRPKRWMVPGLMREACDRGFRIVAGSDPLPFPGEERRIGKYGVMLTPWPGTDRFVTDLRHALRQSDLRIVGRRDDEISWVTRLARNAASRRDARSARGCKAAPFR